MAGLVDWHGYILQINVSTLKLDTVINYASFIYFLIKQVAVLAYQLDREDICKL